MKRDFLGTLGEAGRVVHVVGEATNEVFRFLGPASAALARRGVEQAVVMIDEPRNRHYLSSLHDSVKLVLVPSARNPISQLRALLQASRSALAARTLHAVHLHGLLPGFVSAGVARAAGEKVPIYYSPQRSRLSAKPLSIVALARRIFQPGASTALRSDALLKAPDETPASGDWKPVLVENPVAAPFFVVARQETQHPLVIAGGRKHSARSAENFAQLAVLLSDAHLGIGFHWIGTVDAASQARLNAANVAMRDAPSPFDCADQLAAGWIYVAPGRPPSSEFLLPEAMAAGLPCVAMDCPQHRALIRDGETGFLCKQGLDMMHHIAALIDSPSLRASIGQAARAEAKRRFGEDRFSTRLLSTYDLPS